MNDYLRDTISFSKKIQNEINKNIGPPIEGKIPLGQEVISNSLVRGTRSYVEKIVYQINGSYENGWYDCCAVMVRRLIETLIIETFENHKIANKIKNSSGDIRFLGDLIDATLSEKSWNLGRNSKQGLRKLKNVGDQSAHSRRFIAQRHDIINLIPDLRNVVQELVLLSNLKK